MIYMDYAHKYHKYKSKYTKEKSNKVIFTIGPLFQILIYKF